jgi:hypothetical protein
VSLLAYLELEINNQYSEIFIGAPPRSGNTYLRYVLGVAHHGSVPISGNHETRSAIEQLISAKPETIFVTPVRDPKDVVVSTLVWLAVETEGIIDYELTNAALQTVAAYWEIVLTDPSKFCIVDFNDLVNNGPSFITKFTKKYQKLPKCEIDSKEVVEKAYELLSSDDERNHNNDRSFLQARGHLPRSRSQYVDSAESSVLNIVHKKRLEYLYSMYGQLIDMAI